MWVHWVFCCAGGSRRSSSALWPRREGGQTGQLHQEGPAHPAGQVRRWRHQLLLELCRKKSWSGTTARLFLRLPLRSLPEVPALVDVPSVSAQMDDSLLALLRERVSCHGSVSSHPPVLIEELQERPGGVLARWCKVGRGRGGVGGWSSHRSD